MNSTNPCKHISKLKLSLLVNLQQSSFEPSILVEKTFNDLTSVDDIIDWINEIYLESIFLNYTDTSSTDTIILPVYLQNKIISSSVTRVTIRNIEIDPIQSSSGDTTVTFLHCLN